MRELSLSSLGIREARAKTPMSIDSRFLSVDPAASSPPNLELIAPGFPPPVHIAEPDLFCRQAAMPGYDQERLGAAHIAVVGSGGLGSWIGLCLVRMGVRTITIRDPDHFDRTNAPRQLVFPGDLGRPKAHAVARNLVLSVAAL